MSSCHLQLQAQINQLMKIILEQRENADDALITPIAQVISNHLPGLLIDLQVIIYHTIGIVNLQLKIKCESDCISYCFRLLLCARF
jgi:hypothetical protein